MSILKQLLTETGFEVNYNGYLKPTPETLERLNIANMHQWNKLIEGDKDLTINQAKALGDWLHIPFERFNQILSTTH